MNWATYESVVATLVLYSEAVSKIDAHDLANEMLLPTHLEIGADQV